MAEATRSLWGVCARLCGLCGVLSAVGVTVGVVFEDFKSARWLFGEPGSFLALNLICYVVGRYSGSKG